MTSMYGGQSGPFGVPPRGGPPAGFGQGPGVRYPSAGSDAARQKSFQSNTGGISMGPGEGNTLGQSPGIPGGGNMIGGGGGGDMPMGSTTNNNWTSNFLRNNQYNNRWNNNTSITSNVDNSQSTTGRFGTRDKKPERVKPFTQRGYGAAEQLIGNPGNAVKQLKAMNSLMGLG